MRTLIMAVSTIATLTVSPTLAAPFGISMGQPIGALSVDPKNSANSEYVLTTVPLPYPGMTTYAVKATASAGVCEITAFTGQYNNDGYGFSVRSNFAHFSEQLSKKYGKPKSVDRLLPGALWEDPGDWDMAILKGERIFANAWEIADPLKTDNIASITMMVHADSQDSSDIILQYTFSNNAKCDAEIDAKSANAL